MGRPDADSVLDSLVERFDVSADQRTKLAALAEFSVSAEISGTSIDSVDDAVRLHIADSLAALDLAQVREAKTIVDIGSGLGFPGLALAAVLPEAQVTMVDSVRKKMERAAQVARELKLENAECVWARAEEFALIGAPTRESFDVVCARALASLATLVEYAAPLLKVGGSLVAWKGEVSEEELRAAQSAQAELGFEDGELLPTTPFPGSTRRHFYVVGKQSATSERFPRRPGQALKRPLAS